MFCGFGLRFAVMDNHLHVLVRLDGDAAKAWSAAEVVRRWIEVYPPRSATGEDIEVVQAWIDHQTRDEKRVELLRQRLAKLGWFKKALKEPLARMASDKGVRSINRELWITKWPLAFSILSSICS